MSLEAIKTVAEAEKKADEMKLEAQSQSRAILADAQKRGEFLFAEAKNKVQQEIAQLDRQVEQRGGKRRGRNCQANRSGLRTTTARGREKNP